MLGIATISYYRLRDLMVCLRSVHSVVTVPFKMVVWDNTERNTSIRDFVKAAYPEVLYLSDGYNRGCSVGRNRSYAALRSLYGSGLNYFLYLDQDVQLLPGSINDMMSVSKFRPDWGAVSWPQANMSNIGPTIEGLVSDIAGMCALYRPEALDAVGHRSKNGIWDERFLFYRFDSLFAQRMVHEGYYTYLVMKYLVASRSYMHQSGGVIHHHAHTGVQLNTKCSAVKKQSEDLFQRIQREEGWRVWDVARQGKPAPHYKKLRGL